jgi:hypothetical protein
MGNDNAGDAAPACAITQFFVSLGGQTERYLKKYDPERKSVRIYFATSKHIFATIRNLFL